MCFFANMPFCVAVHVKISIFPRDKRTTAVVGRTNQNRLMKATCFISAILSASWTGSFRPASREGVRHVMGTHNVWRFSFPTRQSNSLDLPTQQDMYPRCCGSISRFSRFTFPILEAVHCRDRDQKKTIATTLTIFAGHDTETASSSRNMSVCVRVLQLYHVHTRIWPPPF